MNLIFKDREWALSSPAVDACVKLFGGVRALKKVHSRSFLLAVAHNKACDATSLYDVAMRCFLGGDALRPALGVPHESKEGVAWGTDAHTAIGLPPDLYTPLPHEHKYLDVGKVVASLDWDIAHLGYDVVPLLDADVWGTMEKFYARGEKCQQCEGEGEQRCDLGHDHSCENCRGEGYLKHYTGLVVPEELDNVRVGAQVMRSRYVHKVLSVCEMLGIEQVTRIRGCKKGTLWTGGTALFLIMPINSELHATDDVRDLGKVKQGELA